MIVEICMIGGAVIVIVAIIFVIGVSYIMHKVFRKWW